MLLSFYFFYSNFSVELCSFFNSPFLPDNDCVKGIFVAIDGIIGIVSPIISLFSFIDKDFVYFSFDALTFLGNIALLFTFLISFYF
jgi:hypothetical protein